MTTCGTCSTTYGGYRTEHCTECHETFTGTSSGDKHRTGKHGVTEGPTRRRCLTPDEMTQLGMHRNARGRWMLEGPASEARTGQGSTNSP
jgi:hypothetical protein